MQTQIERIQAPTSFEDFRPHFEKGRPLVMEGALEEWPARQKWTPEFFAERHGDLEFSLHRWLGATPDTFRPEARGAMVKRSLREFLENRPTEGEGPEYYVRQRSLDEFGDLISDVQPLRFLPAFSRRVAEIAEARKPPVLHIFERHLWIGHAGTNMPLHYDPWPNLVAQIYGHKTWTVFSDADWKNLYLPSADSPNSSVCPFDISNPDYTRFPKVRDAQPMTLEMNPGDVLYLPAGWAHYVQTKTLSLQVNQWWVPSALYLARRYGYEAWVSTARKRKGLTA